MSGSVDAIKQRLALRQLIAARDRAMHADAGAKERRDLEDAIAAWNAVATKRPETGSEASA